MSDPLVVLNESEKLCLCAMASVLMRADGVSARPAVETLDEILQEIFQQISVSQTPKPYRETALESPSPVPVAEWMEKASLQYPDLASIEIAMKEQVRPEARQLIFDVLYAVATVGTITPGEWKLLDQWKSIWKITD